VVQDEDADRRGKARVALAGIVDLGCELVDGNLSRLGDGAESVPELGLQGHAGAVAVQGERAFGGAGGHENEANDADGEPKSLSKDFDKFLT
jgi:hypothetical protein